MEQQKSIEAPILNDRYTVTLQDVQASGVSSDVSPASGPLELLARVGVSAFNPNSQEFQEREREVVLVEGEGEGEGEGQIEEGELTDEMLKKAAEGLYLNES